MQTLKLLLQSRRLFIGSSLSTLFIASIFVLAISGCHKSLTPQDPLLKPIQEMLDTQLPLGTPQANVSLYLSSQGYELESSEKPGTLVAIIRKIDTQRLEPVTARATFYFDANGKLKDIELQRTLNQPIQ